MPLSIRLREGLRNDKVAIRVDGTVVYDKAGVSTDLTISYADAVTVPAAQGRVKVEVSITGGRSASAVVDVDQTPYAEVWIVDGTVTIRTSRSETPML